MPRRTQQPDIPRSRRIGRVGILALFGLVPLALWGDLYTFGLLPKRLLVQSVLAAIALLWVLDVHNGLVPPPRRTRLHLPLALYLLFMAVAFTRATNPVASLVDLAHQLTFVLLFIVALNTFPVASIPDLLRVGAGVGILVSLIGILESRGVAMPPFLVSNGRPSATFAYRNFAAAYLIMNIPLALALWVKGRDLRDLCLGAVSTGAMLVFLVYTRTRGAWLGLAGAALATALLIGYARWRWGATFGLSKIPLRTRPGPGISVAVLILTAGLSSLPPHIASRGSRAIDEKKVAVVDALASVASPGADRGRLDLWRHSLEIIRDHPVLGVGPGNWKVAYPRYSGGDMMASDSAPERPHNDLLWIASEIGLPGLACYLWLLCAAAAAGIRVLRRPASPERALYAVAFGAGLLAMLGHGLVSFPRELAETSLLFWTGLAVLALLDSPQPPPMKKAPSVPPLVRWALYPIPALLFLSAYMTWDRHIEFDRHYLRALQYHKGGDFASASREADAALKYGAFDSQAFLLLGDGQQAMGALRAAGDTYREGLRYHPDSIQLLGALGTVHARQGNLDRAEGYYEKVLKIYPDYYQMYNNLGGVYQKRGDLNAAIASYRKVLTRDSRHLDAHTNLGLAYLTAGRIDDAIRTCREALQYAPDDPVLHHNLGDAYYRKADGDPAALPLALEAYARFLETWRGPRSDAETARARIAEIRARLSGGGR